MKQSISRSNVSSDRLADEITYSHGKGRCVIEGWNLPPDILQAMRVGSEVVTLVDIEFQDLCHLFCDMFGTIREIRL